MSTINLIHDLCIEQNVDVIVNAANNMLLAGGEYVLIQYISLFYNS